jgi:predicted transport protein
LAKKKKNEEKHLFIAFKDQQAIVCILIGVKRYEIEVSKKELLEQLAAPGDNTVNAHNDIYI